MDAYTSYELEAQRRREIIGIDRRAAHQIRTEAPVDAGPLARVVTRPARRLPRLAASECEPTPLARQAA